MLYKIVKGVTLAKKVKELVELLELVKKQGGTITIKPPNDKEGELRVSVLRIEKKEGDVNLIVTPAKNPGAEMSIDGETDVTGIILGSKAEGNRHIMVF